MSVWASMEGTVWHELNDHVSVRSLLAEIFESTGSGKCRRAGLM